MKLLVLGATGATGKLLVEQALTAGHGVRALVRTPGKLDEGNPRLEVMNGRATSPVDVGAAMSGVDAVISTLGAMKGTVITDAVQAVISGAARAGVRRVVVLSSFAVLREQLSGPAKAMTGMMMGAVIKDKTAAERLLRVSDLDWTTVHPVRLNNGPQTTGAHIVTGRTKLHMGDSVSRADVAAMLLSIADDKATIRKSLVIKS